MKKAKFNFEEPDLSRWHILTYDELLKVNGGNGSDSDDSDDETVESDSEETSDEGAETATESTTGEEGVGEPSADPTSESTSSGTNSDSESGGHEIENTVEAVANAEVGDTLTRDDGTQVTITQGDIDWAQEHCDSYGKGNSEEAENKEGDLTTKEDEENSDSSLENESNSANSNSTANNTAEEKSEQGTANSTKESENSAKTTTEAETLPHETHHNASNFTAPNPYLDSSLEKEQNFIESLPQSIKIDADNKSCAYQFGENLSIGVQGDKTDLREWGGAFFEYSKDITIAGSSVSLDAKAGYSFSIPGMNVNGIIEYDTDNITGSPYISVGATIEF